MPEVLRGVGVGEILIFSIYEGAFGMWKDRLGMIPDRISPLLCV
ncbi:hypothetical protein E2C01_059932 [Portunus trituberculatus]|uniref:Uncharacterized protein n=1 Tax=Portunus trituberculatus TaxID=210409 RepID=A0A5B7H771_PORTR|nr:hypothetical protein [Portunus trituberculatus]